MRTNLFILLTIFITNLDVICQMPSPAIIASDATVSPGQAVDIVFSSDNDEFWNIVTFNGTITWDPSVCSYSGLVSTQLFQMNVTNFDTSQISNGILTWNWMHMVTIGQSIPRGQEIFTLKFTASSTGGLSTPIDFSSTPNPMYWNNFAGWNGTTHSTPGTFTIIGCPQPSADFSFSNSGLNFNFNNTSQASGITTYLWEFGDGNSSALVNPSHTFLNDSAYNVCLYLTDSCGIDTICQTVQPCYFPIAHFGYQNNGSTWNFYDSSLSGQNTSWEWTFSNGGGSFSQNPSHSFAANTMYTVCLTITDDCGQDTFCDSISTYSTANLNTNLSSSITIYPCPIQNELQIKLEEEKDEIKVKMYNHLGQIVFHGNFYNLNELSIHPEVKNGFYIVELQIENEILYYNLLKQ